MTEFATAISCDPDLGAALATALAQATADLTGRPGLAVVFASQAYADIETIATRLTAALPGVPFIGGTSSGCIFDTASCGEHGVSVSLVGGGDLRATTRAVTPTSVDLLEVASTAGELRRLADEHAREGRGELTCLTFAPSQGIIGDALVAALKKGAQPRTRS